MTYQVWENDALYEFSLYILNLCDLKNKKIEGDLKRGKKLALELALQATVITLMTEQ